MDTQHSVTIARCTPIRFEVKAHPIDTLYGQWLEKFDTSKDQGSCNNPMLQIWIASHLNDSTRFQLLKHAIQSAHRLGITAENIRVSVTTKQDDIRESIATYCTTHNHIATLTIRPEKQLSQFEHLHLLCKESSQLPDDMYIMFLDDDDLLLPNALDELTRNPQTQGFVGWQYIPIHKEDPDQLFEENETVYCDTAQRFLSNYGNAMLWAKDFSGTCTRLKHVRHFFNYIRPSRLALTESLADTRMIEMIEHLQGCSDISGHSPIALHRIIKHRSSDWQDSMVFDLQQLNEQHKELQKQYQFLMDHQLSQQQ